MSTSAYLSVELWQTILRYAIGVTDFLDPDAFEGVIEEHLIVDTASLKNDEAAYWAAEKVRNRLQTVCKSWDAYLRHFEHRFVRMLDIRHRKVDIQKLEVALRVCFGGQHCWCNEVCRSSSTGFQKFCSETFQMVEPTRMVIADLKTDFWFISDLIKIPQNFDRVQVLITPNCGFTYSFAKTLQKFGGLRHFYGKGYRGTQERGVLGPMTAKNLVTLSMHTRTGRDYMNIVWDLPRLRHLRLKADSSQEVSDFVDKSAMPILRVIGTQLVSLYFYHQYVDYDIPRELWMLCPNLERLHTGMSLVYHPPYFHPIHTLVLARDTGLHLFPELPEWPNLQRVVVDDGGYSVGEETFSHLKSTRDIIVEHRYGLCEEEDFEAADY